MYRLSTEDNEVKVFDSKGVVYYQTVNPETNLPMSWEEALTLGEAILNAYNENLPPSQPPPPDPMAELKELQLIQMEAQAEISEQTHENTLIIFEALADIFEEIGGMQNG